MIDCPSAVTVRQSDIASYESRRDSHMKRQYYSPGVRGQDTRSRDAGAGSRGVDGDCCEQGLGHRSPDRARIKYSLPYLRVHRSTHCRDR